MVTISKYYSSVTKKGVKPSNPGNVVTVIPEVLNPADSPVSHNPVTIGSPANGLSLAGQVLSLNPNDIGAVTITGTQTITGAKTFGTFLSLTSEVNNRDKLRILAGSSEWAIGIQASTTFGRLNNSALTFQVPNVDTQGWWWGDTAHTTAQGAMALNSKGDVTVARSIRVGGGESDTSKPISFNLDVQGSSFLGGDIIAQGSVRFNSIPSGTGDVLMLNGTNDVVRGALGSQKFFVIPVVSFIGTEPVVTTAGTYSYSYPITASGYASILDLPIGTLLEFEFGMEVNCTVANISGDMDLIISLRLGTYLLSTPISSLLLSTSPVKTLHTTRASFVISAVNTFSTQINQKARRDSGPSYDRDRTNFGAPLTGLSGSNVTVGLVFGQTNADNYLKINHGFLKITLP